MRLFFFITFMGLATAMHSFAQPTAFPQLILKAPASSWHRQMPISLFSTGLKIDSSATVPLQSHLPLDFYSTHLGAACKMELQLEKQTKLPIRLRLGSKEQVDYLEGKFSRNR